MMTQGSDDNFRADVHGEEELVPFDVRDYSGRRAMWILLIIVVLLIVAAVTMFKLYQSGVRDRNAPPRIVADNTPFKVAPDDPGGEVTPNQDKTVYDVMNGTAKTEAVVTAPGSEEPLDMPKTAKINVETLKPAAVQPKTPPVSQPAATRKVPVNNGSAYVVQVASMRSHADAESLWNDIRRNYAGVLPKGSGAEIRRVDLNEKGIYFRLRIVGLSSKDAAARLCGQFKARKQSCFVTRG